MQVTPSAAIGRPVFAPQPFLGGSVALSGDRRFRRGGFVGDRFVLGGFATAAVGAHFFVVDFAVASVGFAAVALLAEQLDVGCIARAAARVRRDVVEFQILRGAATLTHAVVPGVDHFFGHFRHVPALSEAANPKQQKRKGKQKFFHGACKNST